MSDNDKLVQFKKIGDNLQWVYRYENDIGASIIFNKYSYGREDGLFEIATIKFYGENNDLFTPVEGIIDYMPSGIKGYCTFSDISYILDDIRKVSKHVKTLDK